jgi:hypothetical protein
VQATTATTALANQTVCQGTSATFSTTASGTGPFSYAWTLDGGAVSGATTTSTSVTIATSALTGAHTVQVVVTGACGSATRSATLTVNPPPTATVNVTPAEVCLNTADTFGLTANFTSATAVQSISWRIIIGGNSTTLSAGSPGVVSLTVNLAGKTSTLELDPDTLNGGSPLPAGPYQVFAQAVLDVSGYTGTATACGLVEGQGQIIVNQCVTFCTFTQGYWGNTGGKGSPRLALIHSLIQPNGLFVGTGAQKIVFGPNQEACIIAKLPTGGKPDVIPAGGPHTFNSDCASDSAITAILNKNGRFKNVALGQVIALKLNVLNQPELGTFQIPACFTTGSKGVFGSPIDMSGIRAILLAIYGPNGATVNNLLDLSDKVLGGQSSFPRFGGGSPVTVTPGDVAGAAGTLNEAFDECKDLGVCVQ